MKVAIVCGAPSTAMLAPFEDESMEIWVLGNRLDKYDGKRVTRVWEIHDNLSEIGDTVAYRNYLLQNCAKRGATLEVGPKFFDEAVKPLNDDWVVFNHERSVELFGSRYLTSSPAYMMSQAIAEGATEIHIYGVDLAIDDHEYFWQRPCMEAWIGFAKGRGITIFIPEQSHVGKSSYDEGRDWDGDRGGGVFSQESFEAIAKEHQAEMDALQQAKVELLCHISAHNGAKEVYANLAKIARAMEAQIDVKTLKEAISMGKRTGG